MRNLLRKSHKAFKRHAEILKSNSYIVDDGLIALEEIRARWGQKLRALLYNLCVLLRKCY